MAYYWLNASTAPALRVLWNLERVEQAAQAVLLESRLAENLKPSLARSAVPSYDPLFALMLGSHEHRAGAMA